MREHRIRMTHDYADSNPGMPDAQPGSYHFKCTFRRNGTGVHDAPLRRMTIYFTMGPACDPYLKGAEVLDCIISDAQAYDNARDFSDFCSEFGYDAEPLGAYPRIMRIYNACKRTGDRLRRFLGGEDGRISDLYDRLMECERE